MADKIRCHMEFLRANEAGEKDGSYQNQKQIKIRRVPLESEKPL